MFEPIPPREEAIIAEEPKEKPDTEAMQRDFLVQRLGGGCYDYLQRNQKPEVY